ncbi:Immunoglobulin E-set [Phytophthora cactorum]|nr:Immunoglobulin E-set [Phytophthora cactorum]
MGASKRSYGCEQRVGESLSEKSDSLSKNLCLLSQDGSNVGRAICVDRGKWTVGGHVQDGVAVNIDDWSFVAAVFDENSTKFSVDGDQCCGGSLASPLLVVGAAEDQPLTGFTGYLKSVFMFDVALSETELNYLMTTKGVVAEDTEVTPVSTPVSDLVVKVKPTPHLYLKDRLENSVSARQVIDPDADEYNAALPILDDSEFLSVELVYAVDIFDDESSTVDNIAFTLWSLEPKHRALQVGSIVTVQGSPSFDSLASTCRINDDTNISPFKVTAHLIACKIPEMNNRADNDTIKLSVSQNGIAQTSIDRSIIATANLRSINPQVIDIFGVNFANLTTLSCAIGGLDVPATFLSSSRIQCVVESTRFDESLSSVKIDVSVNGVDFSDDPRELELVNAPSMDSLSPDNGPTTGGTVVEISGHGFRENMRYSVYCGQNVTDDVEYVSPSLLIWRTTGVNSTGVADVKLNVEGQLLTVFIHADATGCVAISSASTIRSETILTISGSGFGEFVDLRCSFVTLTSDGKVSNSKIWTSIATFMTSSIVQCPTPSLQDAGSYVVSVSNNAQNFSPASQVARLTLHNEILLENASVMAGPATGGTSVDITGKFLVRSTDVACRFGESRSRAYFVSDTVVRCISPAWLPVIATEGIAPVPIRIALNGLDFSSSSPSFSITLHLWLIRYRR